MRKLLYIDLFCGAGGTSTGVEAATLDGQTARRYKQRHYLKARGYILGAPNEWVAYYDENTRRSRLYESRRPGDRHFAHWDFLPISELKK